MKLRLVLFFVLSVFLFSTSAWALSLGTNITIYDNRSSNTSTWYQGTVENPHEDQEVEPGMVADQVWDLEGFFLNGYTLTVVGGFDFKYGVTYGGHTYTSGDIFIDTDGDATYGDSGSSVINGYDYVIDLDFANLTYNVYAIDDDTKLEDVYSYNSNESSPWQYYHSDNSGDSSLASGSISVSSELTDSDTGFQGGTHYAVTGIDLSFLDPGTDFIAHFTMECGNDNLMGEGVAPVPEPATMLLFGVGLCGLAFVGRKKLLMGRRT